MITSHTTCHLQHHRKCTSIHDWHCYSWELQLQNGSFSHHITGIETLYLACRLLFPDYSICGNGEMGCERERTVPCDLAR